jgi:hypothetical protein
MEDATGMEVREIVGVFVGVLVLAGISVAIVNGGQTAAVIGAGTNGFANLVKAATLRG